MISCNSGNLKLVRKASSVIGSSSGEQIKKATSRYPFVPLNPFRTAVPFRGQTACSLSGFSPKRECGSKRVNLNPFRTAVALCGDKLLKFSK